MPAAALYVFQDFDAPKPASNPAPDPRALERAKADGFEAGRAEGHAQAEAVYRASAQAAAADADAARAEGLRAATAAFETLNTAVESAQELAARATARLTAACLQRLVAELGESHAHARAAAFAREVAQAAADQPVLKVRAGARAAPVAREALTAGRAEALEIVVDNTLAPYAVVADWELGGAEYDAMADAQALADVVTRAAAALAPQPARPHSTSAEPPQAEAP